MVPAASGSHPDSPANLKERVLLFLAVLSTSPSLENPIGQLSLTSLHQSLCPREILANDEIGPERSAS